MYLNTMYLNTAQLCLTQETRIKTLHFCCEPANNSSDNNLV